MKPGMMLKTDLMILLMWLPMSSNTLTAGHVQHVIQNKPRTGMAIDPEAGWGKGQDLNQQSDYLD